MLVYHLAEAADAAVIQASPSAALIVNQTGPTNTGFYNNEPPLPLTVKTLEAQFGCRLTPVILAGFSEGGLVTKRLLDLGGDPDALVIADGTYGTDYRSWTKFAERAKRQERAMLASYSAGTPKPWQGLKAITGFDLKYGTELPQPTAYRQGSLAVLGYGDGNHSKQGVEVLPKMVASAFLALPKPVGPSMPPTSSAGVILGAAIALLAAAGGIALVIRKRNAGRRRA